jgi:hypothetical protein
MHISTHQFYNQHHQRKNVQARGYALLNDRYLTQRL